MVWNRGTLVAVVAVALMLAGCSSSAAGVDPVVTRAPKAASRVPSVTQMTLTGAAEEAHLYGLAFESVDLSGTYRKADQYGALLVESQQPEAGTKIDDGTILHVVVQNPPTTRAPNVVGKYEGDAEDTLAEDDLKYSVTTDENDPGNWKVAAQDPKAGQVVEVGSSVTLSLKAPPPPVVAYRVKGNGSRALITWSTGGTGQRQANGAAVPWVWKMPEGDDDIGYVLLAQALNGTSITCSITVDGDVVSKNTSTGAYSIAECSSE